VECLLDYIGMVDVMVYIKNVEKNDKQLIIDYLIREWGSTLIVLREGEIFDLQDEEGFIAYDEDTVIGLITYRITGHTCEILSLNSNIEKHGLGTSLIEKVRECAHLNKCDLLRVITTNDNLRAFEFFQKRGFRLVKLYINAMDYVRKLKPDVPLNGENNIPLNDELEFEMYI
jgi:N-acetylglutamate synthase-like GNAT family acetyltransferase